MNLTTRIPEVRATIKAASLRGDYEPHKNPSKVYRMAERPTKSPYDFQKMKKRRKIAKASRRKNN